MNGSKGKKIAIAVVGIALLAALLFAGAEMVQRRRIEAVISTATEKLELPYVLGAEDPDAYDCSSLVRECYAAAGVETPRLAVDIGNAGFYRVISVDALQRGDIVCWDTINDNDLSDHVGVYLGNGEVLHASSSKGKVVISSMEGYFTGHFSWGLRPIRHTWQLFDKNAAENAE